jgi:hypothetical protein
VYGIDPVYHKASTKVYRHSYTYPARGFVGAVQDVLVACCIPVDSSLGVGIGLESASGVGTTGTTVAGGGYDIPKGAAWAAKLVELFISSA